MKGSLILDVDFSLNSTLLYVAASGEETAAFNVRSGKEVWSIDTMRSDVFLVDVVPFTNYIVTATIRGVIQVRNYKTGEVVKTAQSKGGGLRDITVMPNGERLLLTTRDGAVHVWDLQNLSKIVSLPVARELDKIAISPDGTRVLVTSGLPVIRILDSASRGERIKERQHD